MKYKVIAVYEFEVEADEPEWAQELVDVNCTSASVHNLEGKQIYPSYQVEVVNKNPLVACDHEFIPQPPHGYMFCRFCNCSEPKRHA